MATRDTLESFIRECLTRDEPEYGKCSAFVLIHYRGGTEQVELRNVKIGSKTWEPPALAETFERVAETTARGIQGRQQFEVLAFFEKEPNKPRAHFPFGKAGESEPGLATEMPTGQGFLQMVMRHNEGVLRLAMQHSEKAMDRQERTIDQISAENRRLMQERFDTMELASRLVQKAAEDDLNSKLRILEYQRSSREREMIVKHLPGIVNLVTGTDIFPSASVDEQIMEAIEENLKPEHMPILEGFLDKQQLAIFMDRMTKIRATKQQRSKEDAATKQLIAGEASGEDNGAA